MNRRSFGKDSTLMVYDGTRRDSQVELVGYKPGRFETLDVTYVRASLCYGFLHIPPYYFNNSANHKSWSLLDQVEYFGDALSAWLCLFTTECDNPVEKHWLFVVRKLGSYRSDSNKCRVPPVMKSPPDLSPTPLSEAHVATLVGMQKTLYGSPPI